MSVPTRKMPAFRRDGRRHVNRRAAKLIRQHAGEVRKYEDLPQEAQLALAHYMAIDGEAWELAPGLEKAIEKHAAYFRGKKRGIKATRAWNNTLAGFLPFYVEQYGNLDFGYISALPVVALIAAVMKDAEMELDWHGVEGWKKYHAWYMEKSRGVAGPKHRAPADDPWPVILSSFDDETLQDGWTRFHQYAENGRETCPAVWFPRQQSRTGAGVDRKKTATTK
jgi:hypothetical protein